MSKSITFTDLGIIFTDLSGDEWCFMLRISLIWPSAWVESLRAWTDVLSSVQVLVAASRDMSIFWRTWCILSLVSSLLKSCSDDACLHVCFVGMTRPSWFTVIETMCNKFKTQTMVTGYTRKPKNVLRFLRNRFRYRHLVRKTFCRRDGANLMRSKIEGWR